MPVPASWSAAVKLPPFQRSSAKTSPGNAAVSIRLTRRAEFFAASPR